MHLAIARALLLSLTFAAFPAWSADSVPGAIADTLEQRLAPCASCHGKQGEGTRHNEYYPRIAGKPASYLYQQLLNFRRGHRTYPQMVYFVKYLADDYLLDIATYYSKLSPAYPPPTRPSTSRESLARGEMLVMRGDPAKNLPSCSACHGASLTGMQPAIPGLVGLYPDYINAQLGAWQRGSRRATDPDCMAKVASKLSGTDISSISAWLAAQPASPTAAPSPRASQPLPMLCGSQGTGRGNS